MEPFYDVYFLLNINSFEIKLFFTHQTTSYNIFVHHIDKYRTSFLIKFVICYAYITKLKYFTGINIPTF